MQRMAQRCRRLVVMSKIGLRLLDASWTMSEPWAPAMFVQPPPSATNRIRATLLIPTSLEVIPL